MPRHNVRIGVPVLGVYKELLNTDGTELGGSGHGNFGAVESVPVPSHRRELSITITVPPLGAVFFKRS